MPTKKKKYNARFPPARIKKIMQKDEEVGKVASTVPVMLSRLLELFTESLILKTNELTLSVNARTLSTSHLKQVILSERKFDFLKDLVAHIPDVQANDEDGGDSNSDQGNRPRPRGRPKKKKEEGELMSTVPKKRGRRPKAVVPLEEDTLLDEYNSEDSETEDADSNENEDIESTSEDATCDQSMMEAVVPHVRKRRRIDDSAAAAATTSSFYDPDSQTRVLVNDSARMMGVEHEGDSANLLTVDSKGSTRETSLLPPPSNVATSWSLAKGFEVPSIEQAANESCAPLNLKTAGNSLAAAANKDTNAMTSATQDLETYLMQQQQELHRAVGLNFGKTSYHADGGVGGGGSLQVPPVLGLLAPPPAHQPISHGLRQPLTSVCMMQPPFARSNLLSPTASEFVSRINSPATLDNTSSPAMLLSPVPNTSGHAVHRMPVVPASFPGQGACLARSTSMPHGTGVASSKPSSSSLATSPEDDYDS